MSEENEGIIASLTRNIENNWRLLLVGVIIMAIALNSSWSNNKSSAENKNSTTPTPQTEQAKQPDQNQPQETTQVAENNINTAAPQTSTEPEAAKTETTISANANSIAQTAAKSEGVTHLARRAIKEYLSNNQENLSAEQKIYAEDYLSKKTGVKVLEVGEKVEFNTNIIKQGIEQAKGLNQAQIENLSKYVPLVKNLN